MSFLSRSFSLAFLLLLAFLSVALAAQWWLQRETQRLRADSIATKRAQFTRTLEFLGRPPEKWDEDFRRELETLLDARVRLAGDPPPMAGQSRELATLSFDYVFPGSAGVTVHVAFASPEANRLVALHQRLLAAIALLALLLLIVPVLLTLSHRETGPPGPWQSASTEMRGLEHFARISVERGTALERESGARQRAEEDLHLSRTLLDQSQEERARLGRDLHDNICQTLYAVSLTLESVRKKMTATPEIEHRLEQCMTELRQLNQEVRAYIKELEPDQIKRQSFAEALAYMLGTLPPEDEVRLVRQLDEEAIALIHPHQAADVVNILREAISNGLRHGRAKNIILRAERGDNTIALAVQDDGAGYARDEFNARQGHGLSNMQARAAALGGSLRVDSVPGKGTRVLLTLPVASAS